MAGEGGNVWEEKMHVDQLDSDSKPTKTVVQPLKRRRGRPRKEESAGKSEGLLLNQGLHRLPAMSLEMELRKRPRNGKQVAGSSEEKEVSQHKTQLPITLTEGIKVLNYTFFFTVCISFENCGTQIPKLILISV